MLLGAFATLVGLAAGVPSTSHAHAAQAAGDLIVTKVPDYVRPYVVRAYSLDGVRVGSQVYRFPVTGPSSDYAFTLISTAAPASTSLGVLPHVCLYEMIGSSQVLTDQDSRDPLRELLLPPRQIQPLGIQRRQRFRKVAHTRRLRRSPSQHNPHVPDNRPFHRAGRRHLTRRLRRPLLLSRLSEHLLGNTGPVRA